MISAKLLLKDETSNKHKPPARCVRYDQMKTDICQSVWLDQLIIIKNCEEIPSRDKYCPRRHNLRGYCPEAIMSGYWIKQNHQMIVK